MGQNNDKKSNVPAQILYWAIMLVIVELLLVGAIRLWQVVLG